MGIKKKTLIVWSPRRKSSLFNNQRIYNTYKKTIVEFLKIFNYYLLKNKKKKKIYNG